MLGRTFPISLNQSQEPFPRILGSTSLISEGGRSYARPPLKESDPENGRMEDWTVRSSFRQF